MQSLILSNSYHILFKDQRRIASNYQLCHIIMAPESRYIIVPVPVKQLRPGPAELESKFKLANAIDLQLWFTPSNKKSMLRDTLLIYKVRHVYLPSVRNKSLIPLAKMFNVCIPYYKHCLNTIPTHHCFSNC